MVLEIEVNEVGRNVVIFDIKLDIDDFVCFVVEVIKDVFFKDLFFV